ncbi:Lipoxygenase-likey domain-containing protein 1, partial [Exaiptasia diaphana]
YEFLTCPTWPSFSLFSGIPYEIAVYTGNVFGAGTDAKVFITLYGEKGISPEKELDTKNSNDFERDHTDIYLLDFPFEGTLKKIKIRHDNSWFGSGWFLEKVSIIASSMVVPLRCNDVVTIQNGGGNCEEKLLFTVPIYIPGKL